MPASTSSSGLSGGPGRPFGYSSRKRFATIGVTRPSTFPPNDAISLTPLDETNANSGLDMTYIVSTSGASRWLSRFIWNSHSKSAITRSPFTIVRAPCLRAKSTTSWLNTSTTTLSSPASASSRNATRSSTVNVVCLWCGSRTTPTTTRSKIAAARRMTSTWPNVTGSKVPGLMATMGERSFMARRG